MLDWALPLLSFFFNRKENRERGKRRGVREKEFEKEDNFSRLIKIKQIIFLDS